jgi:hypothetical protein
MNGELLGHSPIRNQWSMHDQCTPTMHTRVHSHVIVIDRSASYAIVYVKVLIERCSIFVGIK